MLRVRGKKIIKAVGMTIAVKPQPNQITMMGARVNIGRHWMTIKRGCNRVREL